MVRYLFYTIGDLAYQSPLVLIKACLTGWKVFLIYFKTHDGVQYTTKIISPEAALKTIYPWSNESNSVGF